MNEQVEMFKGLLAEHLGESSGDRSIAQMREGYEALGSAFPPGDDWLCETVSAGGIPGELSHCGGAARNTVLYLHGGGYVIGSLVTHRGLVANIGRATAGRVLAIDYRLAPEHPFPAAVEDAVTAYRWMLENDHDSSSTVIAGDSAGGGLTVATLLKLKQEGLPLPAAGICLSPWVDMEAVGGSMDSQASLDPMVQREGLLGMAAAYLDGASPQDPLAAPIYGDLGGLPPLLVQKTIATMWHLPDQHQIERSDVMEALGIALAGLASYLPDPLRDRVLVRALEGAVSARSRQTRVQTLLELAPYLPEPLLVEALEMVKARLTQSKPEQARALTEFGICLPEPLLAQKGDPDQSPWPSFHSFVRCQPVRQHL